MTSVFSTFLETLKKFGLEHYNRYYSTYMGIVVDVNDPEQRGRIKVEVPSLFGKGNPLAQWAIPNIGRIAGKNTGDFFPPYLHDEVDVIFEHGDVNLPMYSGGFWARGELHADFKSDYYNIRGIITKSGQKLLFKESSGKEEIEITNPDGSQVLIGGADPRVLIKHKSGSQVFLDKDGNVKLSDKAGTETLELNDSAVVLKSGGTLDVTVQGNANIISTGDCNVNSKGNLTVAGKAMSNLGDNSSPTNVNGQVVTIAQGAFPVAKMLSKAVGVGNLGVPISTMIVQGSSKVLVP